MGSVPFCRDLLGCNVFDLFDDSIEFVVLACNRVIVPFFYQGIVRVVAFEKLVPDLQFSREFCDFCFGVEERTICRGAECWTFHEQGYFTLSQGAFG